MTKKDKAALELCIKIASRDPKFEEVCSGIPNPSGGWFVSPKTWEEKAHTACHWCQFDSLKLKPWQSAPYSPTVDPISHDDGAIRLRDKMLAAGVSIYHPDPLAALRETKQCAT